MNDSDQCLILIDPSRYFAGGVQVVIAMTGGEVLYFELNALGQLAETERKDMAGDVACLDIGPIPEGRQRARFLVVGSYDSTVCAVAPSLSLALSLL